MVEFLLPTVLTILFLPFLYCLAAWVSYENVFVRLGFLVKDPELRQFAKRRLLASFGFNFRRLNRWSARLIRDRLRSKEDVLASIRSVITDSNSGNAA